MGRREGAGELPGPNLLDGTRAMELSEAANRSLRRDRTVELHYESISEDSTFKSVMTSTGCLIFLAILFVLPIAMIGPSLGMSWTLYIPVLIPPALILFLLLQTLRLAIRPAGRTAAMPEGHRTGSDAWPGQVPKKGNPAEATD
jgi:myo-inositol 2-dehydrogenase/D-chiro-inositol 1-dehydrogenase